MEDAAERRKFHEVAAKFDTAILVTRHPESGLHARPMALARLEENGRAYFSTALDSPKMQEVAAHPEAVATFQNARQFASLTGTLTVSRDAALIDSLWTDDWGVWFPGGKADPSLCILVLEATHGEYWDRAGMKAVSYVFARASDALAGKKVTLPKEQHAKLIF